MGIGETMTTSKTVCHNTGFIHRFGALVPGKV